MSNKDKKRRLDEKLVSAKLSVREAWFSVDEALDIAIDMEDESLNVDIIRDYLNILGQLLSHIDLWKLPVVPDKKPVLQPMDKPYHVQCLVGAHVAHEERFRDEDVALKYADMMHGQWTNNVPDKRFHQFTRITLTGYGRLITEHSEGTHRVRDDNPYLSQEGELL